MYFCKPKIQTDKITELTMKQIFTILFSSICWVGATAAEVLCGYVIYIMLIFIETPVAEAIILLVYLLSLFVMGLILGISAFRMFYHHYQPTEKKAKWLIVLSIITFVLSVPTFCYLINTTLEISLTPPFNIIASVFDLLIPIACITICLYVMKQALLLLNKTSKR